MSDIRWVSTVIHRLPAADLATAQIHAAEQFGGGIVVTQSLASWQVGLGEMEARMRAERNHWNNDDESDGA